MDSEPPAIVWEGHGVCANNDRAETLLRRATVLSMAPGPMWVVNVRLESTAPHAIAAESEITDDDGVTVAHRSLAGSDCDGLARAVGVWASMVVDSELQRATTRTPDKSSGTTPEETGGGATAPWPAPAPPNPPSPEHDWYLHHSEERNIEIGVAAFLMTGAAGDTAMTGPSPFVVIEAGSGLFLRPSLIAGRSLPGPDISATIAATRFDTCVRMPGLYTQHRGMQLDACAGADLGFTRLDGGQNLSSAGTPVGSGLTMPYFSIGPSLELRGELGSALSATLRGLVGLNAFQQAFRDGAGHYVEPTAWTGRVELAFSWGLR